MKRKLNVNWNARKQAEFSAVPTIKETICFVCELKCNYNIYNRLNYRSWQVQDCKVQILLSDLTTKYSLRNYTEIISICFITMNWIKLLMYNGFIFDLNDLKFIVEYLDGSRGVLGWLVPVFWLGVPPRYKAT